jgi:MFS family permease
VGETILPSETRRGWLIVAALSVTVTVSYGVLTYAFGVLLPAMHDDLGWSRAEITGAFSLALFVSALAGLAVGPLLDRRSPRLLMTAGAVAGAALMAAWSRVESLLELYLVFAGLGLAMATLLYEPVFVVVTKWFSSRRNAALTIVTLVGAAASLVFSPLTERLEAAFGWRDAVLVLAVILGAVAIPLHALVLRPSPGVAVTERAHTPRDVLRAPSFWLLAAALTIAQFSGYAVVVHLVSLLVEDGQSTAFAALVAGLLGISQLPGRLVFGLLGRRVSEAALPAVVFGLGSTALVLLALERSAVTAVVFAVAFGASSGMGTLLRPTLVAELWGREGYGAISAVIAAPSTLARAAAPIGASLLVLAPGGYTTLLWILAAGTASAAVAGAVAVRRTRHTFAASAPAPVTKPIV